jgi:hypothetical protein
MQEKFINVRNEWIQKKNKKNRLTIKEDGVR